MHVIHGRGIAAQTSREFVDCVADAKLWAILFDEQGERIAVETSAILSAFQAVKSMRDVLRGVGHSQQYPTSGLSQAHAQDPQQT